MMKHRPVAVFLAVVSATGMLAGQTAQTTPSQAPAAESKKRPLTLLPYTPSLELSFVDRSVDPCTDFYKFSCGGWMAKNPIPPDQPAWSVYAKLGEENAQFLWGILEEASHPSETRMPNQQKIGDYFAACMDEPAIEHLGATPLAPSLEEIAALASKDQLASLLAREQMQSGSRGFLFAFGSNQDFGDASQVIAALDAGGLGLPDRDYYTKTDAKSQDIRKKYVKHVARMLELSGEGKPQAAGDAKTVMDIETALARASLTRVERRNPYNLYHKMALADLAKLAPSLNWRKYFQDCGLSNVATVNVFEPAFFQAVDTELKTVPLAKWKTYLRWHAVATRAPYLSRAFVDEDFDFNRKTLRGVPELPPRWKRCVRYIDRDLGEALGEEFVRRAFTAETKQRTLELTKQVEHAMEGEIKSLDWMTDTTKTRALEKLHAIANKIGYPDKWRDYSSLEIKAGDFFGDVERSALFESRRDLAKIGKPVDRGEWDITPPTVDAYYDPQKNDINFPAGVLQPPLYDPKM